MPLPGSPRDVARLGEPAMSRSRPRAGGAKPLAERSRARIEHVLVDDRDREQRQDARRSSAPCTGHDAPSAGASGRRRSRPPRPRGPARSSASEMSAKCSRNLIARSCVGSAAAVQDRRDRRHAERVQRHPAGAVGLLERAARGQVRAVDRADVVEPEEAALEQVRAVGVLAVDPPGEVDEQLVEDARRKPKSRPPSIANTSSAAHACTGGLTSSNDHSYAGSAPFGCWNHSRQSRISWYFANAGIDVRERDAVEREVPRREPRVLPLVGHRHDVEGVEGPPARGCGRRAATPAAAAAVGSPSSQRRDVVVEELLGPEHPGERLAQDDRLVGGGVRRASARRRTRRPRARRARGDLVEVGPSGSPVRARRAQRAGGASTVSPGSTVDAGTGTRPSCRSPPG